MEEKVACRTPTEGRDGATNIPKWKFDAVRAAILAVLNEGNIRFAELRPAVKQKMSDEDLSNLGSLGWHVTSVKLEMEVRGELSRVPGSSPQIITLGQKNIT